MSFTVRLPSPPPLLRHRIFREICFAHISYELSDTDYSNAARVLECETAAIQAVALTEAQGQTWDLYSRPLVLFERHYFARLTGGIHNRDYPDISNPAPRGYGAPRKQNERLRRAAHLDEQAALKSASWGMFQIMGANHAQAGFATVDVMVDAMLSRASAHLDAFASFIRHDRTLLSALRTKSWTDFARRYNGPGFAVNRYDEKMAQNYLQLTGTRR